MAAACPPEEPTGAESAASSLIVREADFGRRVCDLLPGRITSIGRAATNRIVLRDDLASRHHCELFHADGGWVVRDLESRNGTLLAGRPVVGDLPLTEGDRLRIGGCELIFTGHPERFTENLLDGGPDQTHAGQGDDVAAPEILHRRRETRFAAATGRGADAGRTAGGGRFGTDRVSRELGVLYRLALAMGTAEDARQLGGRVLEALVTATGADVGAVLERSDEAQAAVLVARHGPPGASDPAGSAGLSELVLQSGEAVLAQDVTDDSRLASRDSLGRIRARSLIVAPTREAGRVNGLIHLYATDPDRPLDVEDLEFTLAVADQLGVAFTALSRRMVLSDDLGRAESENRDLRRQLRVETELIGNSPAMHTLREEIGRVAPTEATVLIRGESGVGKELVARAMHVNSRRRGGPFVCLNCAALTESLLESELFGHEKGAFTGAAVRKAGKFEQADGGTLFLDEVGEMGPAMQAKLLRVLEGHPFERVGGGQPVRADVRIVAATNRDLEEAVEAGTFRRDLYYRLHVVTLVPEPLRNRPGDVELLADHFQQVFATRSGRRPCGLTPEATEALRRHDWPGNVRELQNTIERSVILNPGGPIRAECLRLARFDRLTPSGRQAAPPAADSTGYREISLELLEKEHLLATLTQTGWNKSQASQILGIERSTLDRKLKRYRVARPTGDRENTKSGR